MNQCDESRHALMAVGLGCLALVAFVVVLEIGKTYRLKMDHDLLKYQDLTAYESEHGCYE